MKHWFLKRLISDSASIPWSDYFAYLRLIHENQVSKPEVTAFITALSTKPINLNDILCFVRFIESISPRETLQTSTQAINIVGTDLKPLAEHSDRFTLAVPKSAVPSRSCWSSRSST